MKADLKKIEELVKVAEEADLSEVTVTAPTGKVVVKRLRTAPVPVEAVPEPAPSEPIAAPEPAHAAIIEIVSPMVGFFRPAPDPILVGDELDPGDLVGYIESMTLNNEVIAAEGGRVVKILVEPGAAVEYGQPLFLLEPE
jgi:acetyl-CoA carboxylase biotin carboxyl carrier protein